MGTALSTVLAVPGASSNAFTAKTPSLIPPEGLQGGQVFVSFDSREFERVRQEQRDLDAMLRTDIETAVGPSKAQIMDAWATAIFALEQEPGGTVYVSHDIQNADLAKMVNNFARVGVLSQESTVGTIQTPDSSVTFAKGEEGWLFFRTTGNAVN